MSQDRIAPSYEPLAALHAEGSPERERVVYVFRDSLFNAHLGAWAFSPAQRASLVESMYVQAEKRSTSSAFSDIEDAYVAYAHDVAPVIISLLRG